MSSKARGLADLGNAFDDGALSNRNLIINGAMQVAQRGTSFSHNGKVDNWASDRFNVSAYTSSFAATTGGTSAQVSIDSLVAGSPLTNAIRLTPSSDWQKVYLTHKVEGVGHLSDTEVTFSFYGRASASFTLAQDFRITQAFGSGGSSGVNTTATLDDTAFTTSWKRFTVTVTIPSTSAKTVGSGSYTQFYIFNAEDLGSVTWVEITGVQLEVGDTATPFEHRSYGDELARCQRYFYRYTGAADDRWAVYYSSANTTTSASLSFPVTMRATATGSVVSNGLLRVRDLNDGAGGEITPTTLNTTASTKDKWKISVNAQLSNAAQILAFSTVLNFDAEL